ncbi:AAA family ATPase [Actinomadura rubrobrunea]|nr:AAA family ATPase [Actinomadura rubrobrunea]
MRELVARLEHMGASILAEHPEGLRERELWQMVTERLPTAEREYSELRGGGSTTVRQEFSFGSIDLVKAGWLTKTGRRWFLTPVGRHALRLYADPQTFYEAAQGRYNYWNRNKAGFAMVQRLVEAIPEGAWASASELAEETGLQADALVAWLQGARPEGWRRVLDDGGHLPAAAHLNEDDRREWLRALEEEDIDVTSGRADASQRIPGSDLRQLVTSVEQMPHRAWLVRGSNVLGENLIRGLWLQDGICSLPASRLRELPPEAPIEQVKAAIDEDYSGASAQDRARLTAEYHAFLSRMREGDIVVTNDGAKVYVGVVVGPPMFVSSVKRRANLQRSVEWRNAGAPFDYTEDLPDEFSARISNPDAELIEVTEFYEDFRKLLGEDADVVDREMRLPDVTSDFAERLLVGREWLQECVELLRERPQLIFYGPPGTGKTYLAQHLARYLTGGQPETVKLVQFHPAYSYEDFFEGFRPRTADDGQIRFELVRGPFRRMAAAAHAHPNQPYVLIIDEINRGNLAKIFGELYFLLEYRKGESVQLLYESEGGQEFTMPPNVIIIGTMNTADRSIALVDAAMRRRFWFVELHPDEPPTSEMLRKWLRREQFPSDEPARLLDELNRRIEDRDFRIGPSYLMRESAKTEEGLRRIWRTQILPLLEEHHYGDGTDVKARYGLDALRRSLS